MNDLSDLEMLRRAVTNAAQCLNPPQGSAPDPSRAGQWLRTTLPKNHPNYQDAADLPWDPWTEHARSGNRSLYGDSSLRYRPGGR